MFTLKLFGLMAIGSLVPPEFTDTVWVWSPAELMLKLWLWLPPNAIEGLSLVVVLQLPVDFTGYEAVELVLVL